MFIKLAISDETMKPEHGDKGSTVIHNLPYGGVCEDELIEYFDKVISPVVTALVDKKRSEYEDTIGDL